METSIRKLSVIIPVYNERHTLGSLLDQVLRVPVSKEVIIVDDGSTDGSRDLLGEYAKRSPECILVFHELNRGKGQAILTGLERATGDAVIIQDADLEYDPKDYTTLIETMNQKSCEVVYGSRFMADGKVSSFWHRSVNRFLTEVTNLLYGARLTDMETCYKLFRTSFLKNLRPTCSGFEIEVEMTAKTLMSGCEIPEVPISYRGRSFHEGKKIGWRDGVKALCMLVYFRFLYSAGRKEAQ